MSQTTLSLIAACVNLVGLWLIYSLMAYALVQVRWHGRGFMGPIIAILAAELIWILPETVDAHFYFGNTIVTASAVVILCQKARTIPRGLEDLGRMDGCGWFGIYWHVLLPSVMRELFLISLLLVAAMVIPIGIRFMSADLSDFMYYIEFTRPMRNLPRIAVQVIASFVMALLPIVTFFVAKRSLEDRANDHRSIIIA